MPCYINIEEGVSSSFNTTAVWEQHPRSHHTGATSKQTHQEVSSSFESKFEFLPVIWQSLQKDIPEDKRWFLWNVGSTLTFAFESLWPTKLKADFLVALLGFVDLMPAVNLEWKKSSLHK